MKQIFHNYESWEDYQNGMYKTSVVNEKESIQKAVNMLSNETLFYNTCLKVLKKWNISTDVNLTNKNSNRKAWVGQAACCYAYGVPEMITRKAWAKLTINEQTKANLIADKIIKNYERKYYKLYRNMEEPMLF